MWLIGAAFCMLLSVVDSKRNDKKPQSYFEPKHFGKYFALTIFFLVTAVVVSLVAYGTHACCRCCMLHIVIHSRSVLTLYTTALLDVCICFGAKIIANDVRKKSSPKKNSQGWLLQRLRTMPSTLTGTNTTQPIRRRTAENLQPKRLHVEVDSRQNKTKERISVSK